MFSGKKIIVGISGGIAAYKTIYLIRSFIKLGAEVKVVVTPSAMEFVTKTTLETVSNNPIYTHVFADDRDYSTAHISLTDWADYMVVAPATANSIGKMAHGIADDALSTTFISCNKPVFIAPAMNTKMYTHPAVEANLALLKQRGVHIITPAYGDLACGYQGQGRMEEPEGIIAFMIAVLSSASSLLGVKVLVSAGPTQEPIDPVRYITNHSSGIMGYAIANAFAQRGAEVTLVSGPVTIPTLDARVNRFSVVTAEEMYEACMAAYADKTYIVMCAAVADYRPLEVAQEKIKKQSSELTLSLVKTKDILLALGQVKKEHQVLVGFALETTNEIAHALHKLENKNLDYIVVNSAVEQGAGFGGATNKVTIIDKAKISYSYPLKSKIEVANDIIDKITAHV